MASEHMTVECVPMIDHRGLSPTFIELNKAMRLREIFFYKTVPLFSRKELKKTSEIPDSKILHVILTWPLASG